MTLPNQPQPPKQRPVEQIAARTYRSTPKPAPQRPAHEAEARHTEPQQPPQAAYQRIGAGPIIGPRAGQHLEDALLPTDETGAQKQPPRQWHRAPSSPILLPDVTTSRTTEDDPPAPMAVAADVAEDDTVWRDPRHLPSSVRRERPHLSYTSTSGQGPVSQGTLNVFIQRRSRPGQAPRLAPPQIAPEPERETAPIILPRLRRPHPLVFVGLGMLAMLFLYIGGMAALGRIEAVSDDWHYGRPRTFQCDAVVGHHDSPAHPSHFIALNLHRQVVVIEFPGGDSTHATIYLGPSLPQGEDLAPVTLEFRDLSDDGKPDMVILVDGEPAMVYINATIHHMPTFRPATTSDHLQGI